MKKLKNLSELVQIREQARLRHQKVVWTNGCYDILHAGHVLYLQSAKQLGDLLILGLNSDASVRQSKGPSRPIIDQEQRAIVLDALSCVDYIALFDDPSPYNMIAALQPDIYAKGGDYTLDTINQAERRLVEGYGGEIALLRGIDGLSTTAVIKKILQTYQ